MRGSSTRYQDAAAPISSHRSASRTGCSICGAQPPSSASSKSMDSKRYRPFTSSVPAARCFTTRAERLDVFSLLDRMP
jgi:hypothetical protein